MIHFISLKCIGKVSAMVILYIDFSSLFNQEWVDIMNKS